MGSRREDRLNNHPDHPHLLSTGQSLEHDVDCQSFLPLVLATTAVTSQCPVFREEGIPQESVCKNEFTSSYHEICLWEKNTSQNRSPARYPQAHGEIEYFNRTLKPFISYPGRKRLENLHHKLPTDFRLAQYAEMPLQLLCRIHAKLHVTKLWIPILEKSRIVDESNTNSKNITYKQFNITASRMCNLCLCNMEYEKRGEMTITQHLRIARGKKKKRPYEYKLPNGIDFTFSRYSLQIVWIIKP